MKCIKKLIQNEIYREKNVHITLKDIHNIGTKIKQKRENSRKMSPTGQINVLVQAKKFLSKQGATIYIIYSPELLIFIVIENRFPSHRYDFRK